MNPQFIVLLSFIFVSTGYYIHITSELKSRIKTLEDEVIKLKTTP